MNKYKGFKLAALAASIALAMGSTSVMAAAPTATQLPGVGAVVLGSANGGTITSGSQTVTFTGNTVINWGAASGATINATSQPGGFNVGSSAKLGFTDSVSAGSAVLNVDVSGNPSQIFGAMTMNAGGGNLYVANANGIIVGATAKISGPAQVALIANKRGTIAFDGTADDTSIEYQGAGGDVSVAKGATINGTDVLVSGGGVVNVDLSAFIGGAVTLSAGVKNSSSSLVKDNANATLTAAGSLGEATLASFASAGNATNSGALELDNASVAGTFTNTGTLTLDQGFTIAGSLVNQKTVNTNGDVSFGGLTNNGEFNADGFVTSGTFSNSGLYTGGSFAVDGDLNNSGQITLGGGGSIAVTNGSLTNDGSIVSINDIAVTDGDFVNNGNIAMIGDMMIINGIITNSATATLSGVHNLHVMTNDDADADADYSITNAGTIKFGGDNSIYANSEGDAPVGTGSFTNTGTLMVAEGDVGSNLNITAHDDINLGGTLKAINGAGKYAAISEANPLAAFTLQARNGTLSVTQALAFTDESLLSGEQVRLKADVLGGDGSSLEIQVGDKVADDYTVRIANGVTVSSSDLNIHGRSEDDHPNVILQGTLAGNHIGLDVSDLYSGPNGGIVATGDAPSVSIDFTGAIKTAPYLNDANNFRYNYLPITVTGSDPVEMYLSPAAYQTNGKSAVNILVNGSVYLVTNGIPDEAAQGSAVTGVINWPNTHLVLQSTGNIATDGNDYWPGYVYLGTISSDANGALPGTLGLGQITLGGDLNNVLPGSVDSGGGIHFITQFPLVMNNDATVTTNANSWVNFGTDLLTHGYASGVLGSGRFFGGVKGSGNVVNYKDLDPSLFQTQAPVAVQ